MFDIYLSLSVLDGLHFNIYSYMRVAVLMDWIRMYYWCKPGDFTGLRQFNWGCEAYHKKILHDN